MIVPGSVVCAWAVPHAKGDPNPTGAGRIAKSRELPAFAVLLAIQFAEAAQVEVAPPPQPGSATRRQRPDRSPRLPSDPARRDSARGNLPLTTAKFANPPQSRLIPPIKGEPPKRSPSTRERPPPPKPTPEPTAPTTNSPTPLPPPNPRAPPKKRHPLPQEITPHAHIPAQQQPLPPNLQPPRPNHELFALCRDIAL